MSGKAATARFSAGSSSHENSSSILPFTSAQITWDDGDNTNNPTSFGYRDVELLSSSLPPSKTANKPSPATYSGLVAAYIVYGLGVGYYAGIQPMGEWRYFSWHPFLMTSGMVMMMGIAATTKKLGGYTNTKNHGLLANAGLLMAVGGLWVIYQNKEFNGAPHFTSYHGKAGIALIVASVGAGMAGGIVLHPDFGVDKTNKTVRMVHKTFGRTILGCAWATCVAGMYTLTSDPLPLAIVAAPLLVFAPFTLM